MREEPKLTAVIEDHLGAVPDEIRDTQANTPAIRVLTHGGGTDVEGIDILKNRFTWVEVLLEI